MASRDFDRPLQAALAKTTRTYTRHDSKKHSKIKYDFMAKLFLFTGNYVCNVIIRFTGIWFCNTHNVLLFLRFNTTFFIKKLQKFQEIYRIKKKKKIQ